MTTLAFVGGATPGVSVSFTDRWVQSATGVNLPTTARVADNGNRPVYVSTAQFYIAGRSGSRTIVCSVGGYGSAVGVGSASSASNTGNIAINGIFANGGTQVVRLEASPQGSFYFGRASGGTGAVDSYGTNFGALSGQVEYYQVPNAPTGVTVAQAGLENAVNVSWTAPSDNGGTAVDNYRVKWSYNSDMSGSTVIGTGSNATTYKITGLSYGATVYVQVAAVNVVASAAGTSSVYSSTANGYITAPDLPLNGWANFGSHGHSTFEISHTVIPALVPETGIQRKSTSTSGAGNYHIGNYGVEKTYTDLIIGRQYILTGKAILLTAAVPGNMYRFAVNGIGNGSSVTLTSTTAGSTIPSYTFTATATTHTVQIELAESVNAIVGVMEHVAFYDYALTRVANDLIYRLQDNNENATLTDHFDLATQSVGAYWWVDKLNVTQFTQDFDYVFPSAEFSDVVADGNVYYTDIKTAYDTSAVINDITFDNVGRRKAALGSDRFESYDVAWNEKDNTSITNWGARSYPLTTNLYTAEDKTNFIPNPSLAYGPEYWVTGIVGVTALNCELTSVAIGGAGYLTSGATQPVANIGNNVMRMKNNATSRFQSYLIIGGENYGLFNNLGSAFSITPSLQYTFSVYVRGGISQTASQTGWVSIQWQDREGARISSVDGPKIAMSSTAWERRTLTATAPSNAFSSLVIVVFENSANNANYSYYVTGAQYEVASSATTWFSGDTTDNATYVYEWEGEPGASRSIRYLNMMDTRTGELLTDFATPAVRVDSLTWNTAQNPILATILDIGKTITVTFNGTTGTYRVAGISHDINPERWMQTLQLAKVT
jgi:hypothetical protein